MERLPLEHRILRFFGAISYSLYLIHGSIAMALKPSWPVFATGPTWLSFAMSRLSFFATILTISTVLAYYSYIFLERRFLSLGACLTGGHDTCTRQTFAEGTAEAVKA